MTMAEVALNYTIDFVVLCLKTGAVRKAFVKLIVGNAVGG